MKFEEISNRVIGCAIEVHRVLGPGLLESTYEQCLAHESKLNGIGFQCQHPLPVEYKGLRLDCGYRVDLIVEDRLVLELKSVEETKGIRHPSFPGLQIFLVPKSCLDTMSCMRRIPNPLRP